MPRPPAIHHCTSHPARFFGREAELRLLDDALHGGDVSVAAMIGPGGQGKTAIMQHWLEGLTGDLAQIDGLFLWSFYRGKDSDLCLRHLLAYAEGQDSPPDVSASWCVDKLLPRLRSERWAIILDGAEVVQHEHGEWFGRFLHPELGRLVEELASERMPGLVILTSRFEMPMLANRRHCRLVSLSTLDPASARGLLQGMGVHGSDAELDAAAATAGLHAKAVELLGAWLAAYHCGEAAKHVEAPNIDEAGVSDEEAHVLRVLTAFRRTLPAESQDILALATAFRQPPRQQMLLQYLASEPTRRFLHEARHRTYTPFGERPAGWLAAQIDCLVALRLLERVGLSLTANADDPTVVLDAHPLVRRGFDDVLDESAESRAGFLRGRPDRQPPANLQEAREEVELFHAYCDAELWNEADSTLRALDNPKHRFLAPAFERDLLLRFFPNRDWRHPPLWAGFGRRRSLAICFEMLGQFRDAIDAYPHVDAALRGDALLALGELQPFLDVAHVVHPWQMLWHSYRAHGLAMLGRRDESLALALSAFPIDVYEWVHIFEALLRLKRLEAIDLSSLLYQRPLEGENQWTTLARRRMAADWKRILQPDAEGLDQEFRSLMDAYDQAGLPFERTLVRLSYGNLLGRAGSAAESASILESAAELATRFDMKPLLLDAQDALGSDTSPQRNEWGLFGLARP
ncbi:MAG: hypothetical protein K2X38_17075 [Gemmataceae bacterium]|nr:hypothetical protein [Gemmataceae bacterium]